VTANFKQLFPMLLFLWRHAPQRLKYVVAALALIAGLSRNLVMNVVNKAAAAPLDQALSKWLPLFILTFVVVVASSFLYQLITTVATTQVINNVRMKLIGRLLKAQPSFLDKREHGALYHIMTTDVSIVAGFTSTVLNLLPSFIFLAIAIPQLFSYSLIAGLFVVAVMIGGCLAYHVQQTAISSVCRRCFGASANCGFTATGG
jgi:putative ATP-binding cassette transporter